MNLKQKLMTGFLAGGLAAFALSCDKPGEVELAEREYDGKVRIRLTQEVVGLETDKYKLEVQDSTGNVIAYMETVDKPFASLEMENNKVYNLADGGIRLSER